MVAAISPSGNFIHCPSFPAQKQCDCNIHYNSKLSLQLFTESNLSHAGKVKKLGKLPKQFKIDTVNYNKNNRVKVKNFELKITIDKYEELNIDKVLESRQDYSNTLVVADLDGTLISDALSLRHATWIHENGIVDLKDWPQIWRKDSKNEDVIRAFAEDYRKVIIGITEEELCIPEFIEYILKEGTFHSSLIKVNDWRQKGADVYLITGSPEYLAKPFGEKFDFKVFGTKHFKDDAGKYVDYYEGAFTSRAKTKILNELLAHHPATRIIALGDTSSDLALFDGAEASGKEYHRILVNPTNETMEKTANKVDAIVWPRQF